jgi:hypothetical protein
MASPETQTQPIACLAGAQPRGDEKSLSWHLLEPLHLAEHVEEWRKLAAEAVVPNPFYEPWTMLPAIRHLGDAEELRFFLVYSPSDRKGAKSLWGFFPLEARSNCLRVPVRTLSFWQHRYCFLASPLIHVRHVQEVIDAFWRWFERNPLGCHVLDTNYLPADGAFHHPWSDFMIGRSMLLLNEFPRACQMPTQTVDSYLAELFSADRRNENGRKERRLRELGRLDWELLERGEDADCWVDEFLRLEAAGWKSGPKGHAIAKRAGDRAYLRAILRVGGDEGRLSLFSMRLNGQAIAMRSVFVSGRDGFAFKSAYDEAYAKYSPGLLLVIEHLRQLFGSARIDRLDTCTSPRHPLHDATATERRIIRRTLVSSGTRWGDFVISAMPVLRWVKKQLIPHQEPPYLRISTKLARRGE